MEEKTNQCAQLELYRHSNPIVNDAYDRLMATIHLNKTDQKVNTYTFIGCCPRVGTTTIAINLAVSLANSNWKVLLIDSDFRKPKGEKRLNNTITYGLTDYLHGSAALKDVICSTTIPNLSYIACGSHTDNPVQLLCSENLQKLADVLENEFAFIIFDSSAINTSVDATLLAKISTNVILVASQNDTSKRDYENAIIDLNKVNANLLGVVLNKIDKAEYRNHLKNYNHFYKSKGFFSRR